MAAAIKYRIEIDRVKFPTSRYGGNIFIKAGNKCDMTRPRFRGYACMGDAESTSFESFRPDKGSEVTSNGRIIGVKMLLEAFIGAETIACMFFVSIGNVWKSWYLDG